MSAFADECHAIGGANLIKVRSPSDQHPSHRFRTLAFSAILTFGSVLINDGQVIEAMLAGFPSPSLTAKLPAVEFAARDIFRYDIDPSLRNHVQ
jgi:hypothetical protein